MKTRCIKCTSIWYLIQKEPTSCKKSALHFETLMRQLHSKPLPSYVKGTQENWKMLQPHTCQFTTRQMDLGELGTSRWLNSKQRLIVFQPGLEETLLEDSWPLLQSMPSMSLSAASPEIGNPAPQTPSGTDASRKHRFNRANGSRTRS